MGMGHVCSGLKHRTDERILPFTQAPWESNDRWGSRLNICGTVPSAGKEKEARRRMIGDLMEASLSDPSLLLIFTDGSRHAKHDDRKKRTGAAFTYLHGGEEIRRGSYGLGRCTNAFDAEMLALAAASGQLTQITTDHPEIRRVYLFADSSAAISRIYDVGPHPGQTFFTPLPP